MAVYFLPKSRLKPFLARTDLPEDVLTFDVSIKAPDGWDVLSSMFDHGGIPVPGLPGQTSRTVDGIWEGLKKFQYDAEDLSQFESPKPKKRRVTDDSGAYLGHLYEGKPLRDEIEARRLIYVPAYTWMVKHCPAARAKFDELFELSRNHTLHLHDGNENGKIYDDSRPYAYAALLADMVTDARKTRAAQPQTPVAAVPAPAEA